MENMFYLFLKFRFRSSFDSISNFLGLKKAKQLDL